MYKSCAPINLDNLLSQQERITIRRKSSKIKNLIKRAESNEYEDHNYSPLKLPHVTKEKNKLGLAIETNEEEYKTSCESLQT